MAKVFVDTNCFIGIANKIPEIDEQVLHGHQGFISVLSCHILFYVNKLKVPDEQTNSFIDEFNLVDLDKNVLTRALTGPTEDLEDNIQLHSAAQKDCQFFLTLDKKLLDLKFFGKTQVISPEKLNVS